MKSKVTKVTKFDKTDSYGNTSFTIEFENGDKGYYTSKSADQKKFVVGEETQYHIEEKVGKNGKSYFKVTPPQSEFAGKAFGGKAPVDPRVQMISFAMAYCKDLVVAGKVPITDMEKQFNSIYNVMTAKI